MAIKDPSDSDDMITDINVTPFVDVVLVLLILFMLAAPVVYQTGIRVQLPAAVTAGKMRHITLKFTVSENGEVWLEGERLPAGSIEALVKKALSLDPAADAMLSADKRSSHGSVLEVIDAVRRAGIRDIALGTTGVT